MRPRVTIKDIAREVGVHHSTVSRALRKDPRLAPETIERVREAVHRLGYEPDPMLRALAAYRQTSKPPTYRETFAFVWPDIDAQKVASSPYFLRFIRGARERAREVGCAIDEFFLSESTPAALARVLHTRGIRGVIIGPHHCITAAHLRIPPQKLAIVAMSPAIKAIRIHRVEHDHFRAMIYALHHLKRKGHSRISFLSSETQDRVLERRYSAAFLAHHPLGLSVARDLLGIVAETGPRDVRAHVRKTRPDALLMTYSPEEPPEVEVGRRRVPLFSLDLLPGDGRFSGIYQDMEQVASNAVDLLLEQITHGNFGPPEHPKIIFNEGRWLEAGQAAEL